MDMPVKDGVAAADCAAADRAPAGPFDFTAAVDRFESPLLRYLGQILAPDAETAEELAQETFLRLHQQVDEHGPESIANLSSWLFRVAHNLAMNAINRKALERKAGERMAGEAAAERPACGAVDGLDELAQREACRCAMAELQNLPDGHRQALLLKVIQGFSMREIGEITGLAAGSIAYRINQGLRQLASRLKALGVM